MHPPLVTGRGPSPWNPPPHLRTELRLSGLEVLAWFQLAALLLWSAYLLMLRSLFFNPPFEGSGPSAAWLVSRGTIWSLVLALGCFAIVVAWRHRRGKVSHAAALGALAAPLLAALVASRIVWLPTPI
jgi:hypothetical protein